MFPEIVQRYQNLDRVTPDVVMNLEGMIGVDDDNAPVPENIPTNEEPAVNNVFNNWGDDGICQRKAAGAVDIRAFVKNMM